MDKQIIELTAHCIADIILETTPNNPFFGLARLTSTIPVRQDYITKYLFNRLDGNRKNKIIDDDILYRLITEQPINIQRKDYLYYPSGYLPRLILSFSPEYYTIGTKYTTHWKQIYNFLTGKTDRWWTKLSKKWMENTGEKIFCATIHHRRQQEREECDIALMNYTHLPSDIIHLIITYF